MDKSLKKSKSCINKTCINKTCIRRTSDSLLYQKNINDEFNKILISQENFLNEEIDKLIEKSNVSKWLKKIDLSKELNVNDYTKNLNFKKVSNIILDNELNKHGKKKRKSVIKFDYVIPKKEWKIDSEWIYL